VAAGRYDGFVMLQGSDWDQEMAWKAGGELVDLTGFTARMQVRRRRADPDPPLLDLTTENGGIELGSFTRDIGQDEEWGFNIFLHVSAEATTALDFDTAAFDLEMVSDKIQRKIGGYLVLSREVTR
jgi:hypothetical protein